MQRARCDSCSTPIDASPQSSLGYKGLRGPVGSRTPKRMGPSGPQPDPVRISTGAVYPVELVVTTPAGLYGRLGSLHARPLTGGHFPLLLPSTAVVKRATLRSASRNEDRPLRPQRYLRRSPNTQTSPYPSFHRDPAAVSREESPTWCRSPCRSWRNQSARCTARALPQSNRCLGLPPNSWRPDLRLVFLRESRASGRGRRKDT